MVDIHPTSFTIEKQKPSTNVTTNESPDAVHEGSLVDSIRKSGRNVNSLSEQTETENFKKWFGDWQNDPAKASKVVNEDGTPKVWPVGWTFFYIWLTSRTILLGLLICYFRCFMVS